MVFSIIFSSQRKSEIKGRGRKGGKEKRRGRERSGEKRILLLKLAKEPSLQLVGQSLFLCRCRSQPSFVRLATCACISPKGPRRREKEEEDVGKKINIKRRRRVAGRKKEERGRASILESQQ